MVRFAGQYFFQSYRSFFSWPKFFYRTVFCGWVSFTALLPTRKSRKKGRGYLAKNKTFDFPLLYFGHELTILLNLINTWLPPQKQESKSGFCLWQESLSKELSRGKSSLHSHFLFIPFLFSLISMQKCIYTSFLSFFFCALPWPLLR